MTWYDYSYRRKAVGNESEARRRQGGGGWGVENDSQRGRNVAAGVREAAMTPGAGGCDGSLPGAGSAQNGPRSRAEKVHRKLMSIKVLGTFRAVNPRSCSCCL